MVNWYRAQFFLSYKFRFSLADLDNMFPYEREIYLDMIMNDKNRQQADDAY